MVAVDSLGQYGDPNLGFAPPCSETTDRGMRKGAVWITSWSVVDAFTHKEPRYFPQSHFKITWLFRSISVTHPAKLGPSA